MDNLVKFNFAGKIYPVNPKGGVIMDQSVISPIEELPNTIDVGIIALDAEQSVLVIDDLGKKKIKLRDCHSNTGHSRWHNKFKVKVTDSR